jgi:hypothetical protein
MTTVLILRHYNLSYESILKTDAFNGVITNIFSQLYLDGEWHSMAYFSKTIALAECNYKIYNKEMLAIVRSLL